MYVCYRVTLNLLADTVPDLKYSSSDKHIGVKAPVSIGNKWCKHWKQAFG